jgi:tRNA pseudouridine55 synthase
MIIGTAGSSRLFPLMEHFTKTYETTIRLDGTTASYDLEEPIQDIQISDEIKTKITQKYLEKIIQKNFIGEILQSPPLYSAVWINGQRAYELARKGETRKIEAKKRTIHKFEIIEYIWPEIICRITVSHGTYIRSIARDMGEIL